MKTSIRPRHGSLLCRFWPFLPLLGIAAEPFLFVYVFLLLPGFSVWCALGVLFARFLPKKPDQGGIRINVFFAVLGFIPFALIRGYGFHI